MEDSPLQSGTGDLGEPGPDIDGLQRLEDLGDGAGTGGEPQGPRPPGASLSILRPAGREALDAGGAAPVVDQGADPGSVPVGRIAPGVVLGPQGTRQGAVENQGPHPCRFGCRQDAGQVTGGNGLAQRLGALLGGYAELLLEHSAAFLVQAQGRRRLTRFGMEAHQQLIGGVVQRVSACAG
jgi:hypothetical protein